MSTEKCSSHKTRVDHFPNLSRINQYRVCRNSGVRPPFRRFYDPFLSNRLRVTISLLLIRGSFFSMSPFYLFLPGTIIAGHKTIISFARLAPCFTTPPSDILRLLVLFSWPQRVRLFSVSRQLTQLFVR